MFRTIDSWRRLDRMCIARIVIVCAAIVVETGAARAQDASPALLPGTAQGAASSSGSEANAQPSQAQASGHTVGVGGLSGPPPTKAQLRQAERAYLDGANKLDHDQPVAAQHEFERAALLDPGNASYAIALEVARQRRLIGLVRQASEARRSGDESKAKAFLTEAQLIDPASPLVLEHAEPTMSMTTVPAQAAPRLPGASAVAGPGATAKGPTATDTEATASSWQIAANAAGPVHLAPSPGTQDFDLGGDSAEVVRRVLEAYGIHVLVDDSVEHKNLRFRMDGVTYTQAVRALAAMANVFLVPVDTTMAIAAKDDESTRMKLERQVEETIYLHGIPTDQFNQIMQLLRGIFDHATFYQQPAVGAIVVRAPEDVLAAVNQTLQGLQESSGEVVIEVRLYEVDTTKMVNAGADIPTQFGLFNVDQAAAQLVSQNASLVQQAIAQGLISATASNFEIAAALIGSGLVQSSLLNSTIGVFGGGLTQTGITETGSLGINLGLSSSDTRALDDVQLRVGDRQEATFREGSRYPVTSSTFSVGLSGAAGALGNFGNATVNGVPISSLISQASQATTVPQITYEDLGITLDAIPVIEKSGRINLQLDLKLEALTGNAVNNIPVLASRAFKSSLTVAEGQSALLSSMVSSSEISAMSGLPGISELPGFQLPVNENVQKQTMQLVVVVTPHIIRRRSSLVAGPLIMLPPGSAGQ